MVDAVQRGNSHKQIFRYYVRREIGRKKLFWTQGRRVDKSPMFTEALNLCVVQYILYVT